MANTKNLTIKISPALHKKIVRAAKKEGVSMTELVRNLLYDKTKR